MNHRRAIAGLYLLFGVYLIAELAFSFTGMIDGLRDYFAGGFDIAAYVAAGVIFLVPVSCFVLAYLVNANSRHFVVLLLAAHVALVAPIALVIAAYLLWWYIASRPRMT